MLQSSSLNELQDKIGVCQAQSTFSETNKPSNFTVFPNPFSDYFEIKHEIKFSEKNSVLKIFNMNGSLAYSCNPVSGNRHIVVNTQNFDTGIYFFMLSNKGIILEKGSIVKNPK
ncbi:MAG: hypothetical protein A2275_03715 [Bacteroidetes bacterium RIFOXYA12_FULL_35_11]|nr:MAG: hypothetical protein A2X01_11480 [Bacteroidetes bacterium GWF2_35_48]OFY73400.1 MAG: hypothetical protein A2275_03715 [Bacteroidetes bacterium RIFOXYA12_FULL_35_11]OFY95412.1 MAG: hypothetical protein A2309_10180 [Bacteroidetes bacterium RIFOXYB2_FULL_35_7]OFY96334.1 MAG: hypothetical protein A2491_06320 [Bacteroidetes bacterium RIFOXYC12_FULL_35_7]HBX53660.1 hypothetical protein [Bacteroidales bacterium]